MKSQTSLIIFRIIAWFAAIYHVALGLAATFGNSEFVVPLVNKVYGATINIDPDLFMILARFAGSYMVAFGLMMALLAMKPFQHKRIVWVAVVLIAIRIFDRIMFFDVFQRLLNMTVESNTLTIVVIGLMALGLMIFIPKKQS